MEIKLQGRHGRVLTIDADNEACPDSVFIMGERGFCMEFDKETARNVMKQVFGFYEPIEFEVERFLASVAA